MNDMLIKTWNQTVSDDDEVYHLGDVSLTNQDKTMDIINRLNGKIYLIKGNHEKSIMMKSYTRDKFEWIRDLTEVQVNGQLIVLCHYAMRVWNKSHHGTWHLYGHSHDSLEKEVWGRSMDVGVDSANRILGEYRPFSFDEISRILSKREFKGVDHHEEK
jgi:calcineurin-like phosphoesterase family protein